MFFRPDQPNALRSGILNAMVVPRPIGWISTLNRAGQANLAPYSFFNAVAYRPPQVMFSATGAHDHGGLKDSVANIEATGEFVVNLATWTLREAVNASSIAAPHGYDEFAHAGLGKSQVRGGQAAPSCGEPGPSRMRAVPDRRARSRLRPTVPTAWSSAASSASTSPTG